MWAPGTALVGRHSPDTDCEPNLALEFWGPLAVNPDWPDGGVVSMPIAIQPRLAPETRRRRVLLFARTISDLNHSG